MLSNQFHQADAEVIKIDHPFYFLLHRDGTDRGRVAQGVEDKKDRLPGGIRVGHRIKASLAFDEERYVWTVTKLHPPADVTTLAKKATPTTSDKGQVGNEQGNGRVVFADTATQAIETQQAKLEEFQKSETMADACALLRAIHLCKQDTKLRDLFLMSLK